MAKRKSKRRSAKPAGPVHIAGAPPPEVIAEFNAWLDKYTADWTKQMRIELAKQTTMSETLRAAVRESGVSQYKICKATGILATSLSRFMRGETSLRLDKADALAAFFRLELRKRKAK